MVTTKKIYCTRCTKKCSGSVLRVQDQYYHIKCFEMQKKEQHRALSSRESGKADTLPIDRTSDSAYDAGSRSATIDHFTSIGKTSMSNGTDNGYGETDRKSNNSSRAAKRPLCLGCNKQIQDGKALIALDAQWHIWCFKCIECGTVLHGEYVARDGKPYCERDYEKLFGIVCVYCKRYITGKVLQAGQNHHFHPSCARCSKCGDPFVPGEEMYLQSEVIWHPRCGPGPEARIEDIVVDNPHLNAQFRNNRATSPSLSSVRSRSTSPYSFMARQYGNTSTGFSDADQGIGDLSRIYSSSYLTADPPEGYLKRPIEPNPPKSPQFSRPMSIRSRSSSRSGARDRSLPRPAMQVMVESLHGSTPRPRSPSMQNEEPKELAQYPAAKRPSPDEVPKIEQPDFPAPPFPYQGKQSEGADQESPASPEEAEKSSDDEQLRKEEEELAKIATGIGKVFLEKVRERERLRAWKRAHLDPRNASRTPSATRELPSRLRYDNPLNASPSRDQSRSRGDYDLDGAGSSLTRSPTARSPAPSSALNYYKVVPSMNSAPKPGYGLSSGGSASMDRNRSSDYLAHTMPHSESHYGHRAGYYSTASNSNTICNSYLRRSMPNVNFHMQQDGTGAAPKLYPYHLLITSNYRLPPDVDRCHLERHLSNEEFHYIFNCDRLEFYRLPEWRQKELKRRAKLF
ncbi:Actin-binding LIM protein 3 [Fragariocoptes setiger]|uniref:Actin-binding LIM protein 3 n=1 Tax=Fragariocoptes setiger TaxID=1670756 RepID=A0ABQ7S7A2_9ACAR|nr:Actin-binding LIM protein 3 [Fragariocoptes setiger]